MVTEGWRRASFECSLRCRRKALPMHACRELGWCGNFCCLPGVCVYALSRWIECWHLPASYAMIEIEIRLRHAWEARPSKGRGVG